MRARIVEPALLLASLGAYMLLPAAPWSGLDQPANVAVLGYLAAVPLLAVLRALRAARAERVVLAVVLALLPLVYLAGWMLDGRGAWGVVEAAGAVLFVGLAVAGAGWRPELIGAGLVAHGLLWDSWHHGRVDFVAEWYPLACALADVALGAYAWLRARAWRAK